MAGRYPNTKGKPGRKREWQEMVITRVKLNPEQAVLSCCNQAERARTSSGNSCWLGCPTAGPNAIEFS